MPKSIRRIPITEENGDTEDYLVIDELDGLIATAQLGALELHTWGSHAPKVERPDVMVFDLDPDPTVAWKEVARSALDLRAFLSELGLESLVKTTGGKGLHVVVPVAPRLEWDAFKAFSKDVATTMERAAPSRFTTSPLKAKRRGKIFVDYLRNGRTATFVAPYSVRARENATVATPITWEELAKGIDPAAFTILTVPQRLDKLKSDPWADYDELAKQVLSAKTRRKVAA